MTMRNNSPYRSRALFSAPRRPQPPKKKWRIHYVIWGAIKRTCMVLGAFVLISAVLGSVLSGMALRDLATGEEGAGGGLPNEMVLYLPLEDSLIEHENAGPYGFQKKQLTLRDVIFALDEASRDKRVKGFVVKVAGGQLDLAHVEELRQAIARFRESGKFAYIYGPSYESLSQYYFASAFDQIWLQPVGVVAIPGVQVEMPYGRALLDKIGVEPQFFARKEYKNLFESLTSTEMSEATREATSAMVKSLAETISSKTAEARHMNPQAFQALIDKGLFTSEQALEAGLVDRVDYTDTFNAEMKQAIKGDPDNDDALFAYVSAYIKDRAGARKAPAMGSTKPRVALVYAVGNIVQNDDTGTNLGAAQTLVENIRDAVEDDGIHTIVLRVDSPGGDPTAAETIRRAVVKAQEKGKKVIVSMSNAAASGGYWISANADYIFAEPTTLTGSIGVTGGKVSLKELWGKIGVNWDGVHWGDNAGLWSMNQPYSATEAERMNMLMDSIYNRFVALVAEGRHMTPEQAEKVARGRVWTGAQAKEIGLVDALGGLDDTLDYVAQLEGAKDRHDISVVVMPRPQTPFEKIMEFLEMQASLGVFYKAHAALFAQVASGLQGLTSSLQSGLVLAK